MDPLSITASIIGIIGGVSVMSKTIKKIKNLPLVLSMLRGAQNSLIDEKELTDDEKKAVLAILQPSHDKAKELERVFIKVRD